MSIVTQGLGSPLLVTQGYGESVTPIPPPVFAERGLGYFGRRREKIKQQRRRKGRGDEDAVVLAILLEE